MIGYSNENLLKTRSEGFGKEVKKRLILGTFVLQANEYNSYFLQAQKHRRLVLQDFTEAFKSIHAILTPVSTDSKPPLLSKPSLGGNADYINDIMTIPASLAGLPASVVPFGTNRIGLQLISSFGKDDFLLNLAEYLESD
jgi:aspartyl-tRNA(Asn)/glutamyl-tRNA(Gln) amidotransferase subunit A